MCVYVYMCMCVYVCVCVCVCVHMSYHINGCVLQFPNTKGKVLEGNNVHGNLCFKTPWPGIARTIHGDHKKFLETYFTPFPGTVALTGSACLTSPSLLGYYFSGDGAYRDAEGNYQITGRVDDVINTKGHRVGTAELESCLVSAA